MVFAMINQCQCMFCFTLYYILLLYIVLMKQLIFIIFDNGAQPQICVRYVSIDIIDIRTYSCNCL